MARKNHILFGLFTLLLMVSPCFAEARTSSLVVLSLRSIHSDSVYIDITNLSGRSVYIFDSYFPYARSPFLHRYEELGEQACLDLTPLIANVGWQEHNIHLDKDPITIRGGISYHFLRIAARQTIGITLPIGCLFSTEYFRELCPVQAVHQPQSFSEGKTLSPKNIKIKIAQYDNICHINDFYLKRHFPTSPKEDAKIKNLLYRFKVAELVINLEDSVFDKKYLLLKEAEYPSYGTSVQTTSQAQLEAELKAYLRSKLHGTSYRSDGLCQMSVEFTGRHTCIMTQQIRMTLPSGSAVRKDTLRYTIHNEQIVFLSNNQQTEMQQVRWPDYWALCFKPCPYVYLNGEPLLDYPLTPCDRKEEVVAETEGYYTLFPRTFSATMLCNNEVLCIQGLRSVFVLYRDGDCTNTCTAGLPLLQRDCQWSYQWFHRERPICTPSMKEQIEGHVFAGDGDSLSFLEGKCIEQDGNSGMQYSRSYETIGDYILLHPTNEIGTTDTLLYHEGVIYNATVRQTKQEARWALVIDRADYKQYPTGKMLTRVYTDTTRSVDTTNIGRTFQRYYIPINYKKDF